jgi:putative endonuclease
LGHPANFLFRMGRMIALRMLEGFVHASDALTVRFRPGSLRAAHLELGRRGEEAAYFYLRRRGFTIVARDWRSGKAQGDLDLVGWEKNTLCFIEVKTRSSREFATAEAAVDDDKMRALRRLARQYLLAMPTPPEQTRFDILSIYYEDNRPGAIELLRNAFSWRAEGGYD